MYHAACKVEFQLFKTSYSQLTFFNFLLPYGSNWNCKLNSLSCGSTASPKRSCRFFIFCEERSSSCLCQFPNLKGLPSVLLSREAKYTMTPSHRISEIFRTVRQQRNTYVTTSALGHSAARGNVR